MDGIGIVIFLVVALPVIGFVVWQALGEGRVRIESGTIGLLIVRGKATSRSLEPGVHYVTPYRRRLIQIYPLREQTYLTARDGDADDDDLADRPLRVALGDGAPAELHYTVRFQVRPDGLKTIHDRFGPEGIKSIVRDRSRAVLADALARPEIGYEALLGERREALQADLAARLTEALASDGFAVSLFSLREVDLGEIGAALQDAARGRAELAREAAAAEVRAARVRNEAALADDLAAGLGDAALRYRQIELWRELAARWDGRGALPAALMPQLGLAPLAPPADRPEATP